MDAAGDAPSGAAPNTYAPDPLDVDARSGFPVRVTTQNPRTALACCVRDSGSTVKAPAQAMTRTVVRIRVECMACLVTAARDTVVVGVQSVLVGSDDPDVV